VTKQNDSEPRAADPYNGYDLEDPLFDFSKWLDGEPLNQEDLYFTPTLRPEMPCSKTTSVPMVLWINLGMHHIPHTGYLPNTLVTSAHSAVRLEPMNYLLGGPSTATAQQVKVPYDDARQIDNLEEFGAQMVNCIWTW